MGLDITAYKKLKMVENPQIDEYGELVNWETEWTPGASMKWSEKHFSGRGNGVDPDAAYTYEDEFGFRAGSYSGYGLWRSQLEQFKGDVAFQELIDFADNEGVIGPFVSKKLFEDFKKYEAEAAEYAKTLEDGQWFMKKYMDWKNAFEYASDEGAVDFH